MAVYTYSMGDGVTLINYQNRDNNDDMKMNDNNNNNNWMRNHVESLQKQIMTKINENNKLQQNYKNKDNQLAHLKKV